FDEVILHALVYRFERKFLVILPGQHDHGYARRLAQYFRKVSAPWLSGRFKSKSTTAGCSSLRRERPAERRSTQRTSTSDLLSTSRRRTRSASPGLSSISKTCGC